MADRYPMSHLHPRLAVLVLACACCMQAQTDVLTANYDNNRTNANLNEWLLNTSNVNDGQFGKLYTLPVDGQVYAQPLYVHELSLPGAGAANVLYVATMHNSVYAFNADAPAGTKPLWKAIFGATVDPASLGPGYQDILREIGILSTPVIDRDGNTIYVANETLRDGKMAFFLHALDLATGVEKLNGPVEIQATVPGTGWGGSGDASSGQLPLLAVDHIQRPGLLLANGAVYIAFGSHGDDAPWHGWMVGYNAADLAQQTAVFCTTAFGAGASIWQGGRGLAADNRGIYVVTGNGNYNGFDAWGQSVLRLTPALSVADWFTPAENAEWTTDDLDFGSNGPILVPDAKLLIAGGKAGLVALLNRNNLGRELANNTQVVETFQAVPNATMAIFNMALWNRPDGPILYTWGNQDAVRAYRMESGAFNPAPVAMNSGAQNMLPFSGMTVSSNAVVPGSGIFWATSVKSGSLPAAGTLHAFDALDLHELWDSDLAANRDTLGNFTKFANPTVANGKVYVPTDSKQVVVYGLLPVAGIQTVVNAASLTSSTLAPGELIAIFGNSIGPATPTPAMLDASGNVATSLAGVTVTFDGVAAPLLYAGPNQINAVVPFSVAGQSSTAISISGPRATPFTSSPFYSVAAPVSTAAPAMFTVNSSGTGQGAILNSDLSANSANNPAKLESTVAIFATGGGLLTAGVADGAVITASNPPLVAAPVSVTISGQPATVSYQGAAPGLVAGMLQINVQVPAGITPGPAVPLTLTVGGTPALNTVTIAVE